MNYYVKRLAQSVFVLVTVISLTFMLYRLMPGGPIEHMRNQLLMQTATTGQPVDMEEINALVSPKTGFKSFERIFRFTLLPQHFEVGRELTHTLKIRRSVVYELYDDQIKSIFE